ncbi:fumarylacetoacetate hydrolase family protein [Scopulibacillus cellulosilyticus]|uniref:Fumarylacetoacetate hydrolase family protein n=1 Tax=Scopulibacillus cellulosilyticus TaxID=2665665 RepID=A0ABW2PWZ7_9BACL
MQIIRFRGENSKPQLAARTTEGQLYKLPFKDFIDMIECARRKKSTPLTLVKGILRDSLPVGRKLDELECLVPIEAEEVWAAGVTYEKSRDERNYESSGGKSSAATFYDKVYDAKRPEIFFKSTKKRTIGPGETVYLRSDSNWQIPEPELGLVLDHKGEILGYTIGNDMSCRDIEGENPLYLPQAKIWRNSCSIGPAIRLAESVEDPYRFQIICRIYRQHTKVFEESASTSQLKRTYEELCSYLASENMIFDGTVLLTGTCIVPPSDFTLQDGDQVEIEIPGIGILRNPVKSQINQSLEVK